MELIGDKFVISPRDLISEIECGTRLHLDWAVKAKLIERPVVEYGPELKLLTALGEAHEQNLIDRFRNEFTFKTIGTPTLFTKEALEAAFKMTKEAIETGIEVISQATFFDGEFLGIADFLFLEKDDEGQPIKDPKGRFVYNPVDAKSARSAKHTAVLQVATYAYALKRMGFASPNKVVLLLGGDKKWEAQASDVIDLAEEFYTRVRLKLNNFKELPNPTWDAPRAACVRCRWQSNCSESIAVNQDISLVQGMRSTTRSHLLGAGLRNLQDLASANDSSRPTSPHEVSRETFDNLRAQADIQVRGIGLEKPIWEPKDLLALGLLPESDDGDIWFDMEGDPFAINGDGLEYMFGYSFLENNKLDFNTFDAKNREEEKIAFANFIQMVLNRIKQYPNMHIYHYAAYEPSAMLRLALRHGIYEFEVDGLIRDGVFVDLYSIIRKVFRFSTESMSIKYIEAVYQDKRGKDKAVATAVDSVIQFESALQELELGNEAKFVEIYANIRNYNKDDCDSTFHLDRWLRDQAQELDIDIAVLRPAAREKYVDESEEKVEPIAVQLLQGIPTNPELRTEQEKAIALLANAIYFHRREERPAWRNIFERANAEIEDLPNFNDVVVATSAVNGDWTITGKQRKPHRKVSITCEGLDIRQICDLEQRPQALYEIAPDGFKIMQGSTRGFSDCEIVSIDGDQIIIDETSKTSTWEATPIALLPATPIRTTNIQAVLRDELGAQVLNRINSHQNPFPNSAWADILLKKSPRQKTRELPHGEDQVSNIISALLDSDDSYVAVQGPPGTGKTYVGSHVIAELIKHGWRVGVVAQSHAVIENILDGIVKLNPNLPIAKKAQVSATKSYHVSDLGSWMAGEQGGFAVGGTIWSFSSVAVRTQPLDLMVIDEAGQFALANSLVALSMARCALLLGDPQQLPQVSQASHPEPVEISVLGHILGDKATMPPELGYFLDTTYRMHPKLSRPVSILQYEGKLHAAEQCSKRNLVGIEPGLEIVNFDHQGNTTSSQEEADAILAKIQQIIGLEWTDVKNGEVLPSRKIKTSDILVVTAYNMQVRRIKTTLENANVHGIRVGTFDKFQGQEAPIVLVSMATSSSEDLPRGIDFLLSPNRLNVAISRAQWCSYLYRSANLSAMEPNSPKGMVQLGKFVTLCKS